MSKLKLSHKEKTYILEYNRSHAQLIERNGFSLEKLAEQPNIHVPLLIVGAFRMHHPKIKEKEIWEVYEAQTGKSALLQALGTMYAETVQSLLGSEDEEVDEKNATWELI